MSVKRTPERRSNRTSKGIPPARFRTDAVTRIAAPRDIEPIPQRMSSANDLNGIIFDASGADQPTDHPGHAANTEPTFIATVDVHQLATGAGDATTSVPAAPPAATNGATMSQPLNTLIAQIAALNESVIALASQVEKERTSRTQDRAEFQTQLDELRRQADATEPTAGIRAEAAPTIVSRTAPDVAAYGAFNRAEHAQSSGCTALGAQPSCSGFATQTSYQPPTSSIATPYAINAATAHTFAISASAMPITIAAAPIMHADGRAGHPEAANIAGIPVHASESSRNAQPQASSYADRRRLHDLPNFSGLPEEWPLFINTYKATTDSYAYSELENLLRLQKCLHGDAKAAVSSMLIHPQHIQQALAALELKFGQPDMLVRSQIRIAQQLPNIPANHMGDIVAFATSVQNLAVFLDTPATQHHLANPTLLLELTGKLPSERRLDWGKVAMNIVPYPTVKHFSEWLTSIARLVSFVAPADVAASETARAKPSRNRHILVNVADSGTDDEPHESCAVCGGDHEEARCNELKRRSVRDRWTEIRRLQLCFVCMRAGHMLPSCDRKQKCGVDGCNLFHHKMLHDVKTDRESSDNFRAPSGTQQGSSAPNKRGRRTERSIDGAIYVAQAGQRDEDENEVVAVEPEAVNMSEHGDQKCETKKLYRVVPVVLRGKNGYVETHALIDDASSLTLIDEDIADELGLCGPTSDIPVQWFREHMTIKGSQNVAVNISGQQSGCEQFKLRNVQTVKNIKLPTQTVNRTALHTSCPHLRGVPFSEFVNAKPKILIGLEHHHLGIPVDVRYSPSDQRYVATKTALGWVVYGSNGDTQDTEAIVMYSGGRDADEDNRLNELVRAFIATEDFGVKMPVAEIESNEIRRARQILRDTTQRIDGRFETGLLWNADKIELPDNYDDALKRLCTIEARMRRDAKYAEQYIRQIESYIAKGYARRLTEAEARDRSGRTWYLPHFAVQNVNKPGKFRLVFDAAAKTSGVSLNDKLLVGPDVNIPLARLLMQFRMGSVGVCADIREMYLQINIIKDDQDAQRFLWRAGDSTIDPATYVMSAMTFGSTCSPSSALYVKNLNAAAYEAEFPEAVDAIRRKHYVDDFVASFDSADEAVRTSAGVTEVHRRGGFELRGFVSNSQAVLNALGVDTGPGHEPVCMQKEPDATEKVLGMCWDTAGDAFVFRIRFSRVRHEVLSGERCPTKRELLSVTMSVFDPYGFLANFMLTPKSILQDLWRLGVGWDERIPATIAERWHEWRTEIERIESVKIPRCYSPSLRTSRDVQLHIFADASETAFAAVAYWRVVHEDGVDVSFILGKTRCAPLKILSVPRLELEAAVLAARMLAEIRESLAVPVHKTTLWSDSATVLSWLRSEHRKYKQFVAFRVAEIVEVAPAACWRWVPTGLNPADDATRVQRPPRFDAGARWIWGPAWLRENEDAWPSRSGVDVDEIDDGDEVRSKFVGIACMGTNDMLIDYERFSKYRRLCRAFAWMLRFAKNARRTGAQRVSGELSAIEIEEATLRICIMVQRECYAEEHARLRDGREVTASSTIFRLKPYIDNEGVMRVYGRTDAADDEIMAHDTRRPILLPRHHRFTLLLVRDAHARLAHQLIDATIAELRRRFWVPQARVLVRSVQKSCLVCKKRSALPRPPIQGQLPIDRLTPYLRPFTSTGLDFFGPVAVTIGRRREKRWVALFTCVAIRAVHLEIAADLSADACIMCVRNLCHLRGTPARIRCDNGTNFIGAGNELARSDNFLNADVMQREMSTRGIEWLYNCPGNPEAGGIWERLVQSIKRILLVTLKEEAPRVETLRAHLLEAANMVNARPLTHLPTSPEEDTVLTPNHFLIGGPNAVTMTGPSDAEPSHIRKQWKICRELSRQFWVRWTRDYLPELTRRSKNYPERDELKPGDLVIVCDNTQPRGKWAMGRVTDVVTGPDGRVRTAEVKTAQGVYRRPVSRLASLDVEFASD